MTDRQAHVLDQLKQWAHYGGQTASDIAGTLSCPEPSVRRTIQELIRLGENISYALEGRYLYRDGVN